MEIVQICGVETRFIIHFKKERKRKKKEKNCYKKSKLTLRLNEKAKK